MKIAPAPADQPPPPGRTAPAKSAQLVRPIGRGQARRLLIQLFMLGGLLTSGCTLQEPLTTPGLPQRVDARDFGSFGEDSAERIAAVWPLVMTASADFAVDANLVLGVIWVESRFRPEARSHMGAIGLMQLMPRTADGLAEQLGLRRARPRDPEFNVYAGTYFLHRLLQRYDGVEELALAAYFAGPGNVGKWLKRGRGLSKSASKYAGAVLAARQRFARTTSGLARTTRPTPRVNERIELDEPPPRRDREQPRTEKRKDRKSGVTRRERKRARRRIKRDRERPVEAWADEDWLPGSREPSSPEKARLPGRDRPASSANPKAGQPQR